MKTRNMIQKVKRRNKGEMDLRGNKVRNKRKNKEKKKSPKRQISKNKSM